MRCFLILVVLVVLAGCGSESNSYPIVYVFDKSEITSSTIYTVDDAGNDVFPNTIFPFVDSGVTQIEFFEQISPDFPVNKITLLNETKLRVEFDQNVLQQEPMEISYSKNQEILLPEFGIVQEGDMVYGQACLTMNAQTIPYLPEFRIDFCNDDSVIDACKRIYNDRMYQMGDSLALSIQRFIFVEE